MIDGNAGLAMASALFVGSHFLLSHPLRDPMVKRFGERGFQGIYSLIAIALFVWMVFAFRAAPASVPLWTAGDSLWAVASLLMLVGTILFLGSLLGNPALPAPGAAKFALQPARGVFAITRHPMMWGFALWAMVHIIVMPTNANIILCGALLFLALAGSAGQDIKKARLMGGAWNDWRNRTSFVPFAGLLAGRIKWADAVPRPHAFAGGLIVWLLATWAHGALGYMPAGLWRWIGG